MLNNMECNMCSVSEDYPLPDDNQTFGLVTEMLGANRITVKCLDGEERMARIPGSMRKREWIKEDDWIIIEPWDWQDEKGDVVYRYTNSELSDIEERDDVDLTSEDDW